ncbi:hydroxyacid-oxoacid transhydrogenase [Candidatus Borrarchaeum sp.]|uniref:hydroxyacid-oxoacid transhydrogenase n=1 Tax=Candidatus Borrarchaeum sp. TaxID=2846742 RepID=UPI0025805343|nr:hydroxyacid-oxoacid transhydrogenase [Candidatus Borrarchaeum sp.]
MSLSELPTDTVWDLQMSRIKFGYGVASEIGYDLKRLEIRNCLIITDPVLAQIGTVDKIKHVIEEQDIDVMIWNKVEPEPSLNSMQDCIGSLKDNNFDGFVAVGGGSSIDSAKVIDLVLTHGGKILDYMAPPFGEGKKIPGPSKPLIAVPTTAGTGSETTPVSVISFPEKQVKGALFCGIPTLGILDPLLTVTMPPSVTASTGMDALVHAIEAYWVRPYTSRPKPKTPLERPVYTGATELTDLFAERPIELIGKHLRRAVFNGNDLEARSSMLLASFLAGVAFSNAGVSVVHAMALIVGGQFHTPHGVTNAVLLPASVEFNIPGALERFKRIAHLLGENIENLSAMDAAQKSVNAIIQLSKDIGIPYGLEAIGVKEEDIPRLAADTFKVQRLLGANPVPIIEDDLKKLFRKAMRNWTLK